MDRMLPTKRLKDIRNSWLYDYRTKVDWYIDMIPIFWIRDMLRPLLRTVKNVEKQRYEWIYYNYYHQHLLLYKIVWMVIYWMLFATIVWLFQISSLFHMGVFTGFQTAFGSNGDRCVARMDENALRVYLSPDVRIERSAFSSLARVSTEEKLSGAKSNVYYQPMDSHVPITFQLLMYNMDRWIRKMGYGDRCVCFYHYGVAIRGGYSQGSFFVDPEMGKVSPSTVSITIGESKYNVPMRSTMNSIGLNLCKVVESKIDDAMAACVQHCAK